jgi:hypothetical protein
MIPEESTPLVMREAETGEGKLAYDREFSEVFSEESFRELPPRQKWDHSIQLIDGHQPPQGKCSLVHLSLNMHISISLSLNLVTLSRPPVVSIPTLE